MPRYGSRSPSPRRRRSPSPRSPRRRSPASRRSPPPGRRYESPPRRQRWSSPARDRQTWHTQQSENAWRRRGRHGDDGSDDDIKAENYQEFRRLKRIKLAEKMTCSIWVNTPSPSPDRDLPSHDMRKGAGTESKSKAPQPKTRDPFAAEREAARREEEALKANAEEQRRQEMLKDIDKEEVEVFQEWLGERKRAAEEAEARRREMEEANAEVGPQPHMTDASGKLLNYGGAMRPGEGERMAAYVQSGKRIPRRGEVGLTADQIEHFETLGYVMSGSRHARMNAIRVRKENQVYTAEEKAALAMFNFEENKRKETKILHDLKSLVGRTLGTSDLPLPGGDE